jgi:hypothetical protein
MTIWGPTEDVGGAIWLIGVAELYGLSAYMAYRRMYRCFFAMDNRTLVGREADAQPRRASRGTDRRHDTDVNRLWQYWSHPLRRIARKQLGFRNLFFGGVTNLHYPGAKGF